jgi:murein DD-endopeptidase MepM/ murein hydrolase activator NlpD
MAWTAANAKLRQRRFARSLCGFCAHATLAACLVLTAHAQNATYGSVRGGRVPLASDEISPQERTRIKAAISTNVDALKRSGRLPALSAKRTPTKSLPTVLLQWPLQMVPGHPEPAPRNVIAFVDHDPNYPGQVLDYACGTRTYDTPDGYNHQGTDITSWPFMQRKQNNDETIVVAAAPGVIVLKDDGQPDHDCAISINNAWNAVYVRHSDGSEAWYGHLKANSLTTKNVGDSVDAGEFLGVMGSSGSSTGPHLHFEVYDANGQLVDPFAGTCNDFNTYSWWANQRPYYEPAIDLVTTGTAPVDFLACPAPEIEHRSSYYQPGQIVYITAFLTDQLRPNSTTFSVYTPAGTLAATRTVPSDSDFYGASFWEWSYQLSSGAAPGVWTAQVTFAGQTQSVEFRVGAAEPPRANAIEYYNVSLDHYFMTSFANEIAILDAGVQIRGWARTGGSFPTYSAPDPELDTVCRFYGTPGLGENTHFYTAFDSECATLQQNPDWIFEADVFFIALPDNVQCQPSTRPVFRLYNQGIGGTPNHRYTTSWPVVNLMQSKGWLLEGVVMCTPL